MDFFSPFVLQVKTGLQASDRAFLATHFCSKRRVADKPLICAPPEIVSSGDKKRKEPPYYGRLFTDSRQCGCHIDLTI